jgi:hypothetical protein
VNEFRKDDSEKPRLSLVNWQFVIGMAKVLTYGAKKYSADNWRQCPDPRDRYLSAAMRHMAAYASGEGYDPETNLSHLLHAGCCLGFLFYFDGEE